MKNYEMKDIRNIAFVGTSGAGKTSLAEQMLYNAKSTTRVGKVEEGNTVMDFNSEEIDKGMSLSLSIAHLVWQKSLINLIDTPGYPDYCNEQLAAASAAESLVFVANAAAGFEVTLEQSMELLENKQNTKAVIVNRMDNEGADFFKVLESIRENTDINPIPVQIPIGSENKFEGVVDVIKSKAYIRGELKDIPADMADIVEENKLQLMEAIAESDDALLEKYFEEGELSDKEMAIGIKKAIKTGKLVPAFACSATHNIAVDELMSALVEYLPSPEDKNELKIIDNEEEKTILTTESKDVIAYVFKSFSDPNIGDIAYVRVFSGSLKQGTEVYVPEKEGKDRIGTMYVLKGKNREEASELTAGSIGGLVKLKLARTYNTIVPLNSKIRLPKIDLPSPVFWQRIKAVNQSDEEKISSALSKLLDEDPTMFLQTNTETAENVIAGVGEQQIELLKKKLKSRYKIDVELSTPAVPYKETIKSDADVSYKHKKQSGGRGQYGEVYFRVKPLERGEGFQFINSIVGGTIPTKYIPAIEKGLQEILTKGIISGNPIVDISVDCYFGSYHDVDSSEMAFKIASWQALKKAFETAGGILLEPVHDVKIIIPEEYMGDVMGDISTRRGKILGMEQSGKKQILRAQIPLSELFNYYPSLKSMTQGRGKFTQKFSYYEKVPDEIAAKVIEAANKEKE